MENMMERIEADSLPGSSKGMCSFSTRAKLNILDQNNWTLQFFKKKRCDICGNFNPSSVGEEHQETSSNPH